MRSVAPAEFRQANVAVGHGKLRRADAHVRARELQFGRRREAERPCAAVFERIERSFPCQCVDAAGRARHVESAVRRRIDVEVRALQRQRRRVLGQCSGDARAQRAGIAGGRGDLRRRDVGFDLSRREVTAKVAGGARGDTCARSSAVPATMPPGSFSRSPFASRSMPASRRQAREVRLEMQCARERRASTREEAARDRRDPASRASTVMRSPVGAGGARRGDLRSAGGKIDRDIANGVARERAARRARQTQRPKGGSLAQASSPRDAPRRRERAGGRDPAVERAARKSAVGRRIESCAGRVDLEARSPARRDAAAARQARPCPERARKRSTTTTPLARTAEKSSAIPPRIVRSATSTRNFCCSRSSSAASFPERRVATSGA